jgi:hypothetical protein
MIMITYNKPEATQTRLFTELTHTAIYLTMSVAENRTRLRQGFRYPPGVTGRVSEGRGKGLDSPELQYPFVPLSTPRYLLCFHICKLCLIASNYGLPI